MTNDLSTLPLCEAAELVRERRVSPIELVNATLAEIERLDPRLNAFITVNAEHALERAQDLTRLAAQGQYLGPLHGIPISVKDNIDSAGVLTTCGSPLFADRVPAQDAGALRRLHERGAVLIGKNNLWELAFGGPHPQFGGTWNPWGTSRTPGGTSSGSAAAVAAGLSYASLGTDTGGSARVPASLTGLVCLKPTYGSVPREGVLPVSYSMDHVCPITRTVKDAAAVFEALTDQAQVTLDSADLRDTTLGVMELAADDHLSDSVSANLEAGIELLTTQGAAVQGVKLPSLTLAGEAARILMDSEAAELHRPELREQASSFGSIALNRLNAAEFIPATAYVRAQRLRQKIATELEMLLQTVDAVIMPAVGVTAFVVEADGFTVKGTGESPLSRLGRFTPLVNLTGHPAIVVPSGIAPDRMPTSLQMISAFGRESALLKVAYALETAAEWRFQTPL